MKHHIYNRKTKKYQIETHEDVLKKCHYIVNFLLMIFLWLITNNITWIRKKIYRTSIKTTYKDNFRGYYKCIMQYIYNLKISEIDRTYTKIKVKE